MKINIYPIDVSDDRPWTTLDKMDPSVHDKKFTHEGYGKG